PNPVQRVPHRRPRRAADLQFGDHAIDALHVRIDGAALIAANRHREGHITDLPRHLVPALGDVELLGRLRRTRLALALAPILSRLPVGRHAGSITAKSAKIAGRRQPAAGAASTASAAVGIKSSNRAGVLTRTMPSRLSARSP